MRTIIFIIGLFFICSSVSLGQNLSKQLESFLKTKAEKVAEKKEKEKAKKESEEASKTDNKENVLTETETSPATDGAIKDSLLIAEEAKDTLPKMSELDSLALLDRKVVNLATVIDTVGYSKREWEAKTHQEKENFPEDYWQKKYMLSEINTYKNFHVLDTNIRVFGWHPYWMGNAYKNYNYNLLTHIAYFSYELNPRTGSYYSIHNWRNTGLIDSAKAHKRKVLLTVTNFGRENNRIFLQNKHRQQSVLIDSLITLLRLKDADGICIDFEAIPTSMRNNFSNFLIDLSRSLKTSEKKYMLTLALPMKDFRGVFDVKNLVGFVDLFVIMGYEFYGKYSKVAGPVAPMSSGDIWWEYNVEGSILEYKVAGIPPRNLLLGVPYYGIEWQTRNLTFPSEAVRFSGYYTYRDIRRRFNDIDGKKDENSGSVYQVYSNRNNRYYQLWYEDTSSLGAKYDLVKKYEIGGIGIWALGYDNGYPEMWQLIANKFALSADEAEEVLAAQEAGGKGGGKLFKKIMKLIKKLVKNPMAVLSSPGPIIKIFGAMFGVGVVGLLLVLKMAKKMKKTFLVGAKGGLIGLAFAMVLIVTKMLKFIEMRELLLVTLGFIIGGFLLFLLTYKYIIRAKDLP